LTEGPEERPDREAYEQHDPRDRRVEIGVAGLLELSSGTAAEGEQKAQLVHREGGDRN
jgi:hypothetical protein